MYRYLTIDEIVTQLSQTLLLKTRKVIANTAEKDMYHFFPSLGQGIINQYNLLDENNPLTEHWHKFPNERRVTAQLDYSDDHPDAVALDILLRLRERLIQLGIK